MRLWPLFTFQYNREESTYSQQSSLQDKMLARKCFCKYVWYVSYYIISAFGQKGVTSWGRWVTVPTFESLTPLDIVKGGIRHLQLCLCWGNSSVETKAGVLSLSMIIHWSIVYIHFDNVLRFCTREGNKRQLISIKLAAITLHSPWRSASQLTQHKALSNITVFCHTVNI